MSLVLVLTLFGLGIPATQAICSPAAVTLRWLRLGDLISLSLLAAAIALALTDVGDRESIRPLLGPAIVLIVGAAAHLTAVQLGRRRAQWFIAAGVVLLVAVISILQPWLETPGRAAWSLAPWLDSAAKPLQVSGSAVAVLVSSVMLGGYLMTMLLGHAYLTAGGEMTQRPFMRLTQAMITAACLRAAIAIVGSWLWWRAMAAGDGSSIAIWDATLVIVRFGVGLLVPIVLTWMAMECVRIRSNQSATGILYVASILVLIGELTALTLMAEHGLPF